MPYWLIVAVHTMSAVFPFAILVMSIYLRRAPRSLYFSYMSLCLFVFSLGYLFEITSSSLETALVAARVQYVGIPFIAPMLLLFTLEFCGFKIRPSAVVGVMAIPAAAMALMQTYPLHTLYYRDAVFSAASNPPHLEVTGALFYYIFFGYTYTLTTISFIIALYHYKKGDSVFRKQAAIMIAASIIPVACNGISVLRIFPVSFDLTSLSFTVTCIMLAYVIFKHGLYRIAPVARERIVETMNDGYILVDMQGLFIDANDAAKKIVPVFKKAVIGARISELAGVPWANGKTGLHTNEFSVENPSGARTYYRTSETLIQLQNKDVGRCIMIYDITESRQLLEDVRTLAERDSLTGLVNRGTLYRTGELMFAGMQQSGDSACALMMDLDYFKNINDIYGHIVGDEVLQQIADTLNSRFRSGDLFGRYGGEELCAFLINADKTEIIRVAQSLRESVERLSFTGGGESFHVTISIGISVYDGSRHHSFESMLADADTALYKAKHDGRNRVALFGSGCSAKEAVNG